MAVRENEDAARALGVAVVRTKSLALALSGAIAAAGGVLYAQTYLYLDPEHRLLAAERSVEMLLVAMIGGAGTVWGPVLGAIVLHLIADTSAHADRRLPGVRADALWRGAAARSSGSCLAAIARLRRA